MTPESRNSSLLGNGGKQNSNVNVHARNKRRTTVSMYRRGKHTSGAIEELLGKGVFYAIRADMFISRTV
jgi:hypothetical protein